MILKNFENTYSILFDLLIAKLLPTALPPIVKAAIKLVVIRLVNIKFIENFCDIAKAIVTPALPDKIPQMSPITSLQKLDTRELSLINLRAILEPFIFFDAIELNTLGSATVVATPTISNRIPSPIKKNSTMRLTITVELDITVSENADNKKESVKAMIVISIVHKRFLSKCKILLSFLTFSEYLCIFFIISPKLFFKKLWNGEITVINFDS